MRIGVIQTESVLDRILKRTIEDVDARKQQVSEAALFATIERLDRRPLSLVEAIDIDHVAVIAEIKRGSPSRGRFPVELDASAVASAYRKGGAAAISCLTDGPFFHGSQQDLEAVADVAHTGDRPIPVLRKDFVVDSYQLLEARAWGADAVLLIVAALGDDLLGSLYREAENLGLSVLVEVHDEAETKRAMALGPAVLGINNRNLKTFEVDLNVTRCVASTVPDGVVVVSESGIFSPDDVRRVADWGADAVLVGESLILSEDRARAVRELSTVPKRSEKRSEVHAR